MDEEMEDTYEYTFTAVEIDLDYEFDAARFFDFCDEETPAEAREAESWFDSAGSYPPSPFVAKLVPRLDLLLETVNISPKSKSGDDMNLAETDSDVDVIEGVSTMDAKSSYDDERDRETSINLQASNIQKFHNQIQNIRSGLTFYNHMTKDSFKTKTKASVKPSYPRSSTLMKPTASQLAKQNKPHQMGGSRFQKSLADKNQKSSGNHCVIEVQAPKRQKLEGGQLCKVGETKQQIHFVHKEPKKDGTGDINITQAKLRITIPREPDLVTAHRAERMRSKTSKEAENMTSTVPRFKARPLNRKILEAPSLLLPKRSTPQLPEFQEFHLRTLERATQHTSATSTSTVPCSNSNKVLQQCNPNSIAECGKIETRRHKLVDTSKEDDRELSHTFKALPLNKKILTSKGDIGVFRNTKREPTVPMVVHEFNFQTEKRAHNPPIELFNKLSLASDPQPSAGSQLKPPQPTCLPAKVLKENRRGLLPQAHEINHATKEKLLRSGGKQNQSSSDGRTTEVGPACGISRSSGIR